MHEAHFCLYTTYVAFLVTNLWKILKNVNGKNINMETIQDFTDILSYDMIENTESKDGVSSQICTEVSNIQVENDSISSLASEQILYTHHTKSKLPSGKQLQCIWCSRVNLIEQKCFLTCIECGKGFCSDNTGRPFWSLHVAHGEVPAPPKKGSKKREARDID